MPALIPQARIAQSGRTEGSYSTTVRQARSRRSRPADRARCLSRNLPVAQTATAPSPDHDDGDVVALLIGTFAWRVTGTLPPPGAYADALVGYPFMLAEVLAGCRPALSMLFLSRTIDRSADVKGWIKAKPQRLRRRPLVDVFICTYMRRRRSWSADRISAPRGWNTGNYRVWVLDDDDACGSEPD